MCRCEHTSTPDASLAAFTLILTQTNRLETMMATVLERLADIQAKADAQGAAVQGLATAFTDLAADVRAALEAAKDPSVDEAAALAHLEETLETTSEAAAGAMAEVGALDAEVGDADGSDTPPTPEPEPAPSEG